MNTITIRSATHLSFLLFVCALALTGCAAGIALHHDMIDNDQVYANSTNEQLLINLARAAADEPPYFVQLGTINNQHTFSGTAQFQPSDDVQLTHPLSTGINSTMRTLDLGGSVGGTVTDQPTFAFTPLAGTSFTQAMSSPISENTFLTYIAENYPADIIARILIQQIAISVDDTSPSKGKELSDNRLVLVNDPQNPTYPMFLQFCSYLRFYQYKCDVYVVASTDKHKLQKGTAVAFDLGANTADTPKTYAEKTALPYPGPNSGPDSVFQTTNSVVTGTNTVATAAGTTSSTNVNGTNIASTAGSTNSTNMVVDDTNTTITAGPMNSTNVVNSTTTTSTVSGIAATASANGPKAADIETGLAANGMLFRTSISRNKHVIMTMSYPNDISLNCEPYADEFPKGASLNGKDPQITNFINSVYFEDVLDRLENPQTMNPVPVEITTRNFAQVLSALAKEESSFEYMATHPRETKRLYEDNYRVNNAIYIPESENKFSSSDFADSVVALEPRTPTAPVHFLLKTYYRETNHPTAIDDANELNVESKSAFNTHCEVVVPILLMKGIPPVSGTFYRKLLSIQHGGSSYSIGDLVWNVDRDQSIDYNRCLLDEERKHFPEIDSYALNFFPAKFSNRSVFSVVSSLFNQVAADPKSLPQQQLIQVQ